jgi:hypothetical protein
MQKPARSKGERVNAELGQLPHNFVSVRDFVVTGVESLLASSALTRVRASAKMFALRAHCRLVACGPTAACGPSDLIFENETTF